MSHRNILVFSDGTGNSSAKLQRTNVWRLYKAVDLRDPQSLPRPRQFAFYDNGVGTSTFRPFALLGGVFGIGLGRNVRELYAFICRTYRPGDKIYAFGFSRGAFTVRVLVGLLMNQGIVPYDGKEEQLEDNVRAAYRVYRRERFKDAHGLFWLIWTGWDTLLRGRDNRRSRTRYDKTKNHGGPESSTPLRIEFVGVWDTVAAYGLPIDELTRAIDKWIWPLSMPDRDLNQRVNRAMHALALDDERHTFHPQLWNEGPPIDDPNGEPPNGREPKSDVEEERLSQVWFAGAHSDVGGGYADEGVSYVSFDWIRRGAKKADVRFMPQILSQYRALSDENGPINNPRNGIGGYYRYNPRRIEALTHTDEVHVDRVKIHESVLRRVRVGQDGYAPIVIPPRFNVARINGTIEGEQAYFRKNPKPGGSVYQAKDYADKREQVFNTVWARRVAYFFTLAATVLLVLAPLKLTPLPEGACPGYGCILSELLDPIRPFIPGILSPWLDMFSSHPIATTVMIVIVLLAIGVGSALETRIRDGMRLIWYEFPATTPGKGTFPAPLQMTAAGARLAALRSSKPYRRFFRLLTQQALPAFALTGAAYLAFAIVAQVIFAAQSSWGFICTPAKTPPVPVLARSDVLQLPTKAMCSPTGLLLKQGATYRVIVSIPPGDPWIDGEVPAEAIGVPPGKETNLMTLGVPLRRHPTSPWFKPFVRIGVLGTDSYPLEPNPSALVPRSAAGDARQTCVTGGEATIALSSEFVARTTGELFFYVNDAIGLHPFTSPFYGNNHGSACLSIERVLPKP